MNPELNDADVLGPAAVIPLFDRSASGIQIIAVAAGSIVFSPRPQ
jgi:hypothetical protein